jgi:Fe-S oxidoreductase
MRLKIITKEDFDIDFGKKIEEMSGIDVYACYQCGICSGVCPGTYTGAMPHTPRELTRMTHLGMTEDVLSSETIWACTSCWKCNARCPREVDFSTIIRAFRNIKVEEGKIASTIQDALTNASRYGNPWGELENKRDEWIESSSVTDVSKASVTDVSKEAPLLYFVGCTPAYDVRCQEVAKSLVEIFNRVGVDYGILGNKEKCCGDHILRLGESGLFEMLAEENIENFKQYNVEQIVTTAPHCYNTIKKDYPNLGGEFQVQHYTQLLSELIDSGKLTFSKEINKVATFHDPCFLGRHNDVYEPPRKILESIPGLTLVEMGRNRENSFCCGGGAGRIWMEEIEGSERMNINRSREAADINPDLLITACPFCLIQLDDGIKVIGKDKDIQVKDVSELVLEAM